MVAQGIDDFGTHAPVVTALSAVWKFDAQAGAAPDCRRIMATQSMYGGEGESSWDETWVALGVSRRLMLDEDRYDRQPRVFGGGDLVMVADVRLDNRDELAEAFGLSPREATTRSDTDFLAMAWERWKEDSFAHLYGDYAFVVWDRQARELILARDHLGARPLHYHLGNGFAAVASMPKGLHALREVPRAPDWVHNAELLALIPEEGPRSFWEGICRVEPGCFTRITRDGAQSRRHWDPRPAIRTLRDPREAVEGMREHLERAVTARLRGAGQLVSAHLSAGLDSSAAATTAAQVMARRDGRVIAFTSAPREGYDGYVAPNRLGDESRLAAETAALYPNMEHVVLRSGPEHFVHDLDRDFHLFDRPLVNSDILQWVNRIHAESSRRGANVVLTATMGNLSFSYDGLEWFGELAGRLRWLKLWSVAAAVRRETGMRWTGALAQAFGSWAPGFVWRAAHALFRKPFAEMAAYSAIRPAFYEQIGGRDRARTLALDPNYRPRRNGLDARLWVIRRIDFGNYQKGALAGWGVDTRDVMTDRRLIEYSLSLPMDCFLRDGRPRALALDVLADRAPDSVLREPRRGAQSIDWHESMTGSQADLHAELLRLKNVPAAMQILDVERLVRLAEQMPETGWNTPEVDMHYRQAMLRALTSGHFLRKASGSNA